MEPKSPALQTDSLSSESIAYLKYECYPISLNELYMPGKIKSTSNTLKYFGSHFSISVLPTSLRAGKPMEIPQNVFSYKLRAYKTPDFSTTELKITRQVLTSSRLAINDKATICWY